MGTTADEMKTCNGCGELLPLDCFYKLKPGLNRKRPSHRSRCRKCCREESREWTKNNREKSRTTHRRGHFRRKYGITLEDFSEMKNSQSGKCAICEDDAARLVVDHCHGTGKIRALLCDPCNRLLGQARDNPETLRKAAEYIDHHERQI